ncbi:hypothetical protein SB717_04995 [Priestia sp. SIMBA_032]|uniref:hypothetical protein n=1 Tax=Priestia sp. SIMBA_032 TaxID=3085775 RepID=UPI0039781A15
MKKMNVLALVFVLMLVLAACNSSKETGGSTSAKNKAIEASIDSASYILVDSDEGATSEEKGLLKVDLKVKMYPKTVYPYRTTTVCIYMKEMNNYLQKRE